MSLRTDYILNWKEGKMMPPETLELFPTFECNQGCIFCPRKNIEKDETKLKINDEKLFEIIKQASELGIKKIDLIGGGEPLKRKVCINLIRMIKEKNMDGYLNTNFSLLNKESLKTLVKTKWDYIKISLHAPNEHHDLITANKSAFKKIVRNVQILNTYKKKFSSDKPVLEFGPVLSNLNYLYIKDFILLAAKLSVQNIFFQPLIEYNNTKKDLKLGQEENNFLKKNLEDYESLSRKLNINLNLRDLLKNDLIEKSDKREIKDKIHCYEPWLHMTIWPNGTYSACSFPQIEERGILGNDSLRGIWFGHYFSNLRKKIEKGEVPEYCKRCVANIVLDNINLKKELNQK